MIPIRSNITTYRQPISCYLLIGINIALFLWFVKLEFAGNLTDVVRNWGVLPDRISAVAFDVFGTLRENPSDIPDAFLSHNPAAWFALLLVSSSIIPAIFLHGSYGQILGNTIFLFVFGPKLEEMLGSGRFVLFYLTCGILTSVVQILVEPTLAVPTIGSNGAIASLLGAYVTSFPKAKIDSILPLVIVFIPIELPAAFYLFWWFVQQGFYGVGQLAVRGGVNAFSLGYLAHGIGILIGAVLVRLMVKRS